MTTWTADELNRIGAADELQIASTRPDGSLRSYVTIWAVRVGSNVYVRSAYGSDNPWYRRALASGAGRIKAGGVERDVGFAIASDPEIQQDIDNAYHAKYDRYGARIVGSVVGEHSHEVTVRLLPHEGSTSRWPLEPISSER